MRWHGFVTARLAGLCSAVLLAVGGCVPNQIGVASGDRAMYERVALSAQMTDRLLSVGWDNLQGATRLSETAMGWSAGSGAVQMAQDILRGTGAQTIATRDAAQAAASGAPVLVRFQQAGLNGLGETYDPGQTMALNAISIAAIIPFGGMATLRIDNPDAFVPRFVLHVGAPLQAQAVCSVALTPTLIDTGSGATLKVGRTLMGREALPPLSQARFEDLPAAERRTVTQYCQAALRRVVSQAIVELGLVG